MIVSGKLIIASAFLAVQAHAHAQVFPPQSPEFLTIDENRLLLGGLPGAAALTSVTSEQLDAFFKALKSENVEYRYIVGSCEDRAHFVAMLARKVGLSVGKVWVIAPARYTLLSRELIKIKDGSGIVSDVTWGHHVAPVILLDNGHGGVEPMVIDQSFSASAAMPLAKWMTAIGNARAKYFVTSTDDYLFNSLNGLTVYDNKPDGSTSGSITLPVWMPNILTGDFQKYNQSWTDKIIADGMAMNDTALAIFEKRLALAAADQASAREAIRAEAVLSSLISGVPPPGISPGGIEKVRHWHEARKDHWLKRLAAMR